MTHAEWIAILSSFIAFLMGIMGVSLNRYIKYQEEERSAVKESLKGFATRINRELSSITALLEDNKKEIRIDFKEINEKMDKVVQYVNSIERKLIELEYETGVRGKNDQGNDRTFKRD